MNGIKVTSGKKTEYYFDIYHGNIYMSTFVGEIGASDSLLSSVCCLMSLSSIATVETAAATDVAVTTGFPTVAAESSVF